jgi:NADH:ubiquinone oxidoreductase subunit 3 (subunit A)
MYKFITVWIIAIGIHGMTANTITFYWQLINRKAKPIDIMKDEPYDCPQKPFGGDEDFIWSPDSKSVIYVCKKIRHRLCYFYKY